MILWCYGLNVAGVTNGQANVVGVNNLYAGAGPVGLCGANPTVNWAYNGSTAGRFGIDLRLDFARRHKNCLCGKCR